MKTLVTGANGFIGRALCAHLAALGHQVVPAVRRPGSRPDERLLTDEDTAAWLDALQDCDSVVHLAGRAHVMREHTNDPLTAFRTANVQASLTLAQRSAIAGVRRLVFVSSIKVNGEYTEPGFSFTPDDPPNPQDPYAISKWEAEQGLQQIAHATGLELVTIRPPLVYGPGVKGNFAQLVRAMQRGWPLPLGAIHNQRSMIALDNLVSFLALCADRARSVSAANQLFLVSDGPAVSTTELLQAIAAAYGRTARLLPLPASWLRLAAALLGRSAAADRLLGSLTVDDSKAQKLLAWQPPWTMTEQLQRMARAETA